MIDSALEGHQHRQCGSDGRAWEHKRSFAQSKRPSRLAAGVFLTVLTVLTVMTGLTVLTADKVDTVDPIDG